MVYVEYKCYSYVQHYEHRKYPKSDEVNSWPKGLQNISVHIASYIPIIDSQNMKQSNETSSEIIEVH